MRAPVSLVAARAGCRPGLFLSRTNPQRRQGAMSKSPWWRFGGLFFILSRTLPVHRGSVGRPRRPWKCQPAKSSGGRNTADRSRRDAESETHSPAWRRAGRVVATRGECCRRRTDSDSRRNVPRPASLHFEARASVDPSRRKSAARGSKLQSAFRCGNRVPFSIVRAPRSGP